MALAGCGSGDDGGGGAAGCSDRLFRAQDEELYVAQATVQNALGASLSTELLAQMRQGARLLRGYVQEHPPCSPELRKAAESETLALYAIDAAVGRLEEDEQSAKARGVLRQALADLREAGRRIRPEAIPGG